MYTYIAHSIYAINILVSHPIRHTEAGAKGNREREKSTIGRGWAMEEEEEEEGISHPCQFNFASIDCVYVCV